jgi:head-tail adaptor
MPLDRTRPIGEREYLVQVQEATDTGSGSGFPGQMWADLAAVWMARRVSGADERFAANQESAYAVEVWQHAYRPDMDPDTVNVPKNRRLIYRAHTYNIRSAERLDRLTIQLVTLRQE